MIFLLLLYLLSCHCKDADNEANVYISEVNPHTDSPFHDFIELSNYGSSPFDLVGCGVSEARTEPYQVRFPEGTPPLLPGEYRSINLVELSGNRINKRRDHVWFTSKDNVTLDDWRVDSTINGYSFSRQVSSTGDMWLAPTLPTQGFVERYPVVGPFVMSRIGMLPVSCQFVRITNIRPHANNKNLASANATSKLAGRSSHRYILHFDMHETIVAETDDGRAVLNKGAMEIPIIDNMRPGDHHYLVGPCTPEEFVEIHPDVSLDDVSGPWDGFINPNGDRVSLYAPWGQCCDGAFLQEEVNWKPEAPWPMYPSTFFDEEDLDTVNDTVSSTTPGIRTFEMERVSLTSISNDPRNWRRVLSAFDAGEADDATANATQNKLYPPDPTDVEGKVGLPLRCSVEEPCPYIDDCTAATCNLTSFTCSYTALACNHPNWTRCYPDVKVTEELATQYSISITEVSSRTTGHGIGDLYWMGVYFPSSVETQYWNFLCTNVSIDCVVSDWGPPVGECASCEDSLPRSRVVIAESVGNGINCASVPLVKHVSCNASGTCDNCADFQICPTPAPTSAPTPAPPAVRQQSVATSAGDDNVGAVVGAVTGSICAVFLIVLAFAFLARRARQPRHSIANGEADGGRRRFGSTAGVDRGFYKQVSSSKVNRRSNRSSARFGASPLGGGAAAALPAPPLRDKSEYNFGNDDARVSDFRSATSMYQVETPRSSNLQYAALPPESSGAPGPPPPRRAQPPPGPVRPNQPAGAAPPSPAPPPPRESAVDSGGAWMQF